ncbi:STR2 Cystathionine gamma-synthase [Candida maltosa Xu316]
MPSQEIGLPIPNIPHAVSVTLPTWEATVGYEEGEDWVVSKMNSGYPLAKRCREFIKRHTTNTEKFTVRVLQLSTPEPTNEDEKSMKIGITIGVVFFPRSEYHLAKNYWQHSGEGISSRMGEYVLKQLFENDDGINSGLKGNLKQEYQARQIQSRSPSITASRAASVNGNGIDDVNREFNSFIEQKYGRVLDLKFALESKEALRRRIAGKIDNSTTRSDAIEKAKRGKHVDETDVYLFPSGMASIFYAHHALLNISQTPKKSVCFGFPYVDTLNILKKFGPGVHFLGLGDDDSLEDLENQLKEGLEIMALFCECPSNPLLKTPNLKKIRQLADEYNFAVVVDETVGNFINIHILPYADMIASSLTKVFSGDSNVLAGSLILNPSSKIYNDLKKFFNEEFEDLFWAEDALWLERNSRDFVERVHKIDATSLKVAELLTNSPLIEKVYYPSVSDSKKYYDEIKNEDSGYGGLMSFLFKEPQHAVRFFNAVNLHKGPSLGTNFTLACPYAILAHYQELDEIAQWGVDRNLIRISIGLEDPEQLLDVLQKSLDASI